MAVKRKQSHETYYGTAAEMAAYINCRQGDKYLQTDTGLSFVRTTTAWVPDPDSVIQNIILSAKVIEIQSHFAKNTAIGTEQTKVRIPKPDFPVSLYKVSVANPSIDSDLTVKLFNRRTFTETGTAILAGSDGTHIQLAATANPTDDHYNTFIVTITGGTGAGQVRTISDYVGATQIATVSVAWVTALDATSTYSIALIRDSLVYKGVFDKAVLTAPIVLANDSDVIKGLFTGGCDVYYQISNDAAVPNADASRFTAIFVLEAVC